MLQNAQVRVAFLKFSPDMSNEEKDDWINKCRRLGLCDIYNLTNYISNNLSVAISSDRRLDWMEIEALLFDLGRIHDIIMENPNRILISEFDMDLATRFPMGVNTIRYDTETDSHTAYCYGNGEIKIVAMNTGAIDQLIGDIERISIFTLNLDVNNKMHFSGKEFKITDEDKTFYYYLNDVGVEVKLYKDDLKVVKTKFNEANSQILFELAFANDVGEHCNDMKELLLSHMREYIEGKFNQVNILKSEFKKLKVAN